MLKELSDDQLNNFKRSAPLLTEAYRILRERMRRAEGVLSASTEALKLVKAEIEKVTKERDEAREQLAHQSHETMLAQNAARTAIRQRDEATAKVDELSVALRRTV